LICLIEESSAYIEDWGLGAISLTPLIVRRSGTVLPVRLPVWKIFYNAGILQALGDFEVDQKAKVKIMAPLNFFKSFQDVQARSHSSGGLPATRLHYNGRTQATFYLSFSLSAQKSFR
jgi:hypothetical protein